MYETGEALAAKLRPGNAGSNDAADQVEVVDLAIARLPADIRHCHESGDEHDGSTQILVRADSAGATHDFIEALIDRDLRFSIGFPL